MSDSGTYGGHRRSQRIRGRQEAQEALEAMHSGGESETAPVRLTSNSLRDHGLQAPTSRFGAEDRGQQTAEAEADDASEASELTDLEAFPEIAGVYKREEELVALYELQRKQAKLTAKRKCKLKIRRRVHGKQSLLHAMATEWAVRTKEWERRAEWLQEREEVTNSTFSMYKAMAKMWKRKQVEIADGGGSHSVNRPQKRRAKAKCTMGNFNKGPRLSMPQHVSGSDTAPGRTPVQETVDANDDDDDMGEEVVHHRSAASAASSKAVMPDGDDDGSVKRSSNAKPKAKSTAMENLRKARARGAPSAPVMEPPNARIPPMAPVQSRYLPPPGGMPMPTLLPPNLPPKLPDTGASGKGKKVVEFVGTPVGKGRKVVDFAGAPVGKGRKVPAEPWYWPSEIMTRNRAKQGQKAMMYG
eukprot:TRINITY_DN53635_c0_g1_i1.p1 TRINITY_DN53635_c0_g1~~TRINITY_DN53635_c0_g1_i1.p1  ORF type:complete len:414 (-),score=127.16 TRINITY_DN53635_c0_g1_i1:111-1352(-)